MGSSVCLTVTHLRKDIGFDLFIGYFLSWSPWIDVDKLTDGKLVLNKWIIFVAHCCFYNVIFFYCYVTYFLWSMLVNGISLPRCIKKTQNQTMFCSTHLTNEIGCIRMCEVREASAGRRGVRGGERSRSRTWPWHAPRSLHALPALPSLPHVYCY